MMAEPSVVSAGASLLTYTLQGDIQYLVHPQKLGTIEATIKPDALIPVTLLTTDEIFGGDVDALLTLFDNYDDVFQPDFGSVLIEKTPSNASTSGASPKSLASGKEVHRMQIAQAQDDFEQLPSGPYFLHGPNLYQAWRLYSDDFDAFVFGTFPENVKAPQKGYQITTSLNTNGLHKAVPVPSRLYHSPPSKQKPLNGLRVALSDSLELRGAGPTKSSFDRLTATSSLGSDETHKYARQLIDLGAVVVGKTKTGQFGPGSDFIEVPTPKTPRIDGLQRSFGTAAGASAALTAYDWLSAAISLDDLWGITEQAVLNGHYAVRLSSITGEAHQNISLSRSPELTRVGVSSRLLDELLLVSQLNLTEASSGSFKPVDRLVRIEEWESWLSDDNYKKEKALYEEYVHAIENYLGIKSEPISIKGNLAESMQSIPFAPLVSKFGDKPSERCFLFEFWEAHKHLHEKMTLESNNEVYVEPAIRDLWSAGSNISDETYAKSRQDWTRAQRWFEEHVLHVANSSTAVLSLFPPLDVGNLEDPKGNTKQVLEQVPGYTTRLGFAQVTVPFAQTPFDSAISGATELKPFSGLALGGRGSEVALVRLVKEAFELGQWRTRIDTGKAAFPSGDNQRRVDDSRIVESAPSSTASSAKQDSWNSPEL